MELIVQQFPTAKKGAFLQYCFLHRHNFNKDIAKLYSTVISSNEYLKCYNILNVRENSDQETVRQAFLKLVKRFHPDSGSAEADATKFQEIERAYRKLQQKFHAERWLDRRNVGAGEYGLYYQEKKNKDQVPVAEYDIKHTAPQHRQYLSFDGYGEGTPAQRHKQYQKMRASTAADSVHSHRISRLQATESLDKEQALIVKDKEKAKNIKTRYGMERLVEDLIQESMARGEFDNLSGKGKPLSTCQDHHNPYVDLVTHKLNQVMIDNGFKPEWIMLQKEIKDDVQLLRERLVQLRDDLSLPPPPLSADDAARWTTAVNHMTDEVTRLNVQIRKFNLIVPLLPNQMLQIDLEKEAQKALEAPRSATLRKKETEAKVEDETLLQYIMSVFNR